MNSWTERVVDLDTDGGVARIEAWGVRHRHLTIEVAGLRISILDGVTPSVHISGDREVDLFLTGSMSRAKRTTTGVTHATLAPVVEPRVENWGGKTVRITEVGGQS